MNTIVFDLDGTLLPMDMQKFMDIYNTELAKAFYGIEEPREIVEKLWASTKHTIKSEDGKKNLETFFEDFEKRIVGDIKDYHNIFETFYDAGFLNAKESTWVADEVVESIKVLKEKGYRLVIATNPMLPLKANYHRISWAGLNKDDFEYISCFEENTFCKPNLAFYNEVIAKASIDPKNAIMVGNDVEEDMIAKNVGMKTYLITDCVIDRGSNIEPDHKGDYKEFLNFVNNLPNLS